VEFDIFSINKHQWVVADEIVVLPFLILGFEIEFDHQIRESVSLMCVWIAFDVRAVSKPANDNLNWNHVEVLCSKLIVTFAFMVSNKYTFFTEQTEDISCCGCCQSSLAWKENVLGAVAGGEVIL
jgi:hypothetical protein